MQKMNEFFSIVRKNNACFRPHLDPEETLASNIVVSLEVNKFF